MSYTFTSWTAGVGPSGAFTLDWSGAPTGQGPLPWAEALRQAAVLAAQTVSVSVPALLTAGFAAGVDVSGPDRLQALDSLVWDDLVDGDVYVNHTVNSGDLIWASGSFPWWTESNMLAGIGDASRALVGSAAWAMQLYEVLSRLRWTAEDVTFWPDEAWFRRSAPNAGAWAAASWVSAGSNTNAYAQEVHDTAYAYSPCFERMKVRYEFTSSSLTRDYYALFERAFAATVYYNDDYFASENNAIRIATLAPGSTEFWLGDYDTAPDDPALPTGAQEGSGWAVSQVMEVTRHHAGDPFT